MTVKKYLTRDLKECMSGTEEDLKDELEQRRCWECGRLLHSKKFFWANVDDPIMMYCSKKCADKPYSKKEVER